MDADMKEGLDALLETAKEAGPEWKEDILGFVEDDLYGAADKDLAESGIEDEEERDAVKAVVAVQALHLAYIEALENIEDVEARAYVKGKIEGTLPPSAGAIATAMPFPPAPAPKPAPPLVTFKPPTLK